ncbi:ThiF family adenylyltransferase [Actinokineospora inagensis]|uniref:ThiF family adenylyltransferase n=1 Tax=Actinokineospora inagensis TaxID=103730 RepID=UPI0003FE8A61|nr:ThiF family adenylyltransferase [Actinokineospora inagensis]
MSNHPYSFPSEYDDDIYWARVARTLGWLGDTDEEARQRQTVLRDTVVGVAGTGGIGGSMVDRLARLGVLHLRIADLDTFEYSNINRQLGAGVDTIGKNKAEIVANTVHAMTPDVALDVFTQGITEESADAFVDGCDFILDEIEPYEVKARYALHRAFHRSERCQFMMTAHVYGNRTFLWKWTKDSMPVWDVLGIDEDADLTPEVADRLTKRLIPEWQQWPAESMQRHWLVENATCPITPGAPPMAQGLLLERFMFGILGIEELGDTKKFPVSPGYAMVDSRTWEAKMVEGKWW